jgi:hypothetical protein
MIGTGPKFAHMVKPQRRKQQKKRENNAEV